MEEPEMTAPVPAEVPLVEQPSAAPTRKWTFVAIAEAIVVLLGVAANFGLDLEISEEDVTAALLGFGAIQLLVGRVIGYFTKNRANPA